MTRHERKPKEKGLITEIEIKELHRLKYFLGIEVAHSHNDIFISQQNYVLDWIYWLKLQN